MVNREIDFLSKSVDVKITCPKCGSVTDISDLSVPIPNLEAENFTDSIESNSYFEECENCGNLLSIDLGTGFGSSWVDTFRSISF